MLLRLLLMLASIAGGLAQAPALVPAVGAAPAPQAAAAPAPAPAAAAPRPAEAVADPRTLAAIDLTNSLVADFTAAYGPGWLYAECLNATVVNGTTDKCTQEAGMPRTTCCGFWTSAATGDKLPPICVRFDTSECPRTSPGRNGAPCGVSRLCLENLVCCDARPYLGGRTAVQIPTCQRYVATDATCPAPEGELSKAAVALEEAPRPIKGQQVSDPQVVSATALTWSIVNNLTDVNGAGSLFASCNYTAEALAAGQMCDEGLVCCYVIQSVEKEHLVPDGGGVCVRPGDCPVTRPGAEGGACATGRQCDTGLMCCDSKPLMGGLTEPMAPTCQRAAACPNIPPQCLRMWASVYEEQRSLLMGERDPANACTATMTACMKGCQEAMYKLGYECVVALRGANWTAQAMAACQIESNETMNPCTLQLVSPADQARWGNMLPSCPYALPDTCNCQTAGPSCLNALYWLGSRCTKYLSRVYGVERTDEYWQRVFLERACTITPFPRGIADVVGNATAQPPCDFDAPTPGLTVARKREDPGATDGPAGATDGGGGGGGGLSAGAAAGIAVGVALAVALAGLLGLLAYRRRRRLRAAPSVEAGKAAERGDSLSSLATGSKWLSDGRTGSRGVGGAGAGAGAGASSLAAAGLNKLSCGASEDALLSYLRSQAKSQASAVSLASRHSSARTSFTSARASGGVDVAPWELNFNELSILGVLGEGSFGRVFLAEWHQTPVACKVLLPGTPAAGITSADEAASALKLSADTLAKLEDEARLLASLRHPNCINFLGFSRSPPCMVTEWAQRGSLAEVLQRAAADPGAAAELTWPRRLAMLLDAATGMLYLHTRPSPIVHRDLKSPNLLVDQDWHTKVTDFNLSKILESDASRLASQASMAATNPRWLAPEVLVGKPASPAADVFAFGVVMWEVLAWALPWGKRDPWQIVGAVLHGGRPELPPADQLPGLDEEGRRGLDAYVALLRRCWAQEAADRPAFDAVAAELRAQLEAAGGPPAPAPGPASTGSGGVGTPRAARTS